MNNLTYELSRWRAAAERAAVDDERASSELFAEADRAEFEAMRARQAANRNAQYTRRRPSRYAGASYDLLRPEQNPRRMVSTWLSRGPRALLIVGPARTGKTTAAYAIANDAHASGVWTLVWSAAELSAALKPEGEPLAFEYATEADLLVLDDLGRERVTDWWLEQLQRILDARCANERRLIVTANATAKPESAYDELVARYGDPLVERILDGGGIVVIDGPAQRELVTEW